MILDVASSEWLRKRTLVMNRLAGWGYPVDMMGVEGLTADGYYEFVLDDSGKRQVDPATNRLMVKPGLWSDPAHWQWMLENAPMHNKDWETMLDEGWE